MLSKQEMFNRAFLGLRSQNFEKCTDRNGQCVYYWKGKHCAWGWVDQSLSNEFGSVTDLREHGVGEAANLDFENLGFAIRLQQCHDGAFNSEAMKDNLLHFAETQGLEVPK
jgi:hypothetical protein